MTAVATYVRPSSCEIEPAIEEFAALAQQKFVEFQGYYEEQIRPALERILDGFGVIIAFVREHWPEIMAVIGPMLDCARAYCTLYEIRNALERVWGAYREPVFF